MRLWDIDLWVYAFRADSPLHQVAIDSIQGSLDRREAFLFNPGIASSFLRLFADVLESHPDALHADIDEMAFGIFKHLSRVADGQGNEIHDAFLAALAIRHDALMVTADRGFQRYKGLQVEVLGDQP
jgi:predicted nucleic acid-binding protein